MALSLGNPAVWSDIRGLYTTLRSIESTHGLSQIPDQADAPSKIFSSTITDLNTYAANAHSEGHLSSRAYTTVASPTVGTLIDATIVSTIKTNINNMNGVCHLCSQCGDCGNCNCQCCGFSEGFR